MSNWAQTRSFDISYGAKSETFTSLYCIVSYEFEFYCFSTSIDLSLSTIMTKLRSFK